MAVVSPQRVVIGHVLVSAQTQPLHQVLSGGLWHRPLLTVRHIAAHKIHDVYVCMYITPIHRHTPQHPTSLLHLLTINHISFFSVSFSLPARRRPQGLVVIGVCLSVSLCALFLSARYLKNRFMDHHQIWWVGAGGEPLESILVLIGFRMRIQDHFSISVNLDVGHGERAGLCPPRTQ